MRLEGTALADEALHTPQHVPALYCYDATMALIAMQYIKPPAIILRKGLCQVWHGVRTVMCCIVLGMWHAYVWRKVVLSNSAYAALMAILSCLKGIRQR
jgi:hypothetical protein